MDGQDVQTRNEVEAHALCAVITCHSLRERDIRLRGFDEAIDLSWIGMCGKHYSDLQQAWILGNARPWVIGQLGLTEPEPDDGV